ncbi:TPA: potassium-transporting ATPase subunit C, partial [Salmonella enterica]|nr:potassium-transporting ATPase subunit C [Salmonella enterica]
VEQVAQLVAEYTHRPLAGFLGQPVVNIVELNLALDALQGHRAK